MEDKPPRSKILLVIDDEPRTVKAILHLVRHEYQGFGCSDATKAVAMFEQCFPGIILCDQKMPGITGSEVLAQIRILSPETIRILMTAYADMSTLISAVNNGGIFSYVSKPFDPEALETVLRGATAQFELFEKNEILRGFSGRLNAIRNCTTALALAVDPLNKSIVQEIAALTDEMLEKIK